MVLIYVWGVHEVLLLLSSSLSVIKMKSTNVKSTNDYEYIRRQDIFLQNTAQFVMRSAL